MRLVVGLLVVAAVAPARAESALVKARPYYARMPKGYDPARAAPLLVYLQPYYPGNGRRSLEAQGLEPILDDYGLLLAAPDGTLEHVVDEPRRFWNATDACCDFYRRGIDDVAYLDAVIADMRARYRVDERRIFLLGYSNGGYMTHRMLCERAGTIAAGASIAGAAWKDATRCQPAVAAALLEIHGDADEVVHYQGGTFLSSPSYPSAVDGVEDWARKIGCTGPLAAMPVRDLMPGLPGPETTVRRYSCPAGAAELWTVHGGGHRGLSPTVRAAVEFLVAHPKLER